MKPSIGRIIHVTGGPSTSNGAPFSGAMITRVWVSDPDDVPDTKDGPVMVNATAFADLATPQLLGSMMLYETREEAERARNGAYMPVGWWPERV